MSNIQREAKYYKLSKEQKLLILQTRLALETDFRMCYKNTIQKAELWKRIQQQLKEQDSSMTNMTVQKIRSSYKQIFVAYKTMKTTGSIKGTWEREIYEMFEKAFAADEFVSSNCKSAPENDIYHLVLNARLSRETEFKNSDQNKRTLLWQKILQEVKTKAVGCTEDMSISRIRNIFSSMLSTYKRKKENEHMSSWPYFDQLDKVYGNDIELERAKDMNEYKNIEQMVLNARLSREAEFQKIHALKHKKLWQEILGEVKANAAGRCTMELNSDAIRKIFRKLLFTYRIIKRKQNISCWPYFDQIDKIYGHEYEMKKGSIEYRKLEQLVLNARLSRDAEFKKYSSRNTFERNKLWQEILCEVKANAVGCCTVALNKRKIQKIFAELYKSYGMHKRKKTGSSWPYFDQMNKIYEHDDKTFTNFNNELKQLVLNARLCRETKFNECPFDRKLLWQEVLCEVKAKVVSCSEDITMRQIQLLFHNMLSTYKRAKRNKHKSCWPYFDQIDKVYGNYDFELKLKSKSIEYSKLKQILLNARLSREAEFKKYSAKNNVERNKLWQDIFREVKVKAAADCCTMEFNKQQIKRILTNLYDSYRVHKRKKNVGSWPYFDQMDKVYGNCEPFEIFTVNSDNEDVQSNDDGITLTGPTLSAVAITPATAKRLKFLKEKAFSDRKIFQQICDIEKNILQLQRAEIDELRKLIIILKAKQKN